MATDELPVLDGKVDDLVGIGEVEGTAARYDAVLASCVSSSAPSFFHGREETEGDSRSRASHFMLFSHVT